MFNFFKKQENTKIKKQKCFLVFLFSCFLVLPIFSLQAAGGGLGSAFDSNGELGKVAGKNGAGYNTAISGSNDIYSKAGSIIQTILGFLGVLFLCLTIYGGFKWMLGRENAKVADDAINIIKNATIGLIIIASAYAISYLVVSNFNVGSSGNQGTITSP